jgi:hypothetical protein
LQERETGKIRKTHPGCSELWRSAIWAVHRKTLSFYAVNRSGGGLMRVAYIIMRKNRPSLSLTYHKICPKRTLRVSVIPIHGYESLHRSPTVFCNQIKRLSRDFSFFARLDRHVSEVKIRSENVREICELSRNNLAKTERAAQPLA